MPRIPLLFALASLSSAVAQAQGPSGILPVDLRCDWAVDPLGVDSAPPRLSWRLDGTDRGERETGWRVLVASSPEILARNRGDLWDSGRVRSDDQLDIPYRGVPLRSAEQVVWKAMAWDAEGRPSGWSQPATWTMGILEDSDWGARWITHPALLSWVRPMLGYHSDNTPDPGARKWVELDLGRTTAIDSVVLCGLTHTVLEKLGFPSGFELEISNDPGFRVAVLVGDQSTVDPSGGPRDTATLRVGGSRARYVRLTATRLGPGDGGQACLALSQIEVISGGRNVAPGSAVSASDSIERAPWSAAALTDGLGAPEANPRANATLLLRDEFTVRPGLARAVAFVCGLGECVLSCNGSRVGDDLLGTSWTDPERTCLYEARDLTDLLHPGRNAVGLTLAGGMYNVPYPAGRYTKFVGPFRPLKAIAQIRLEYADGSVETVVTGPGWRAAAGPTTYAQTYGGEDFDARRVRTGWNEPGFNDSGWTPAVATEGPGGVLRGFSHTDPPIRAHLTLFPKVVRPLRPGVWVYDLGQNVALMPYLQVRGSAGTTVRIVPAELLRPDGSVDRESSGGGTAYWSYTLAGRPEGESWSPEFFSHGARYLQVEVSEPDGSAPTEAPDLEGIVVHSDSEPDGAFYCSNDLFNQIRSLVRWAQRSNLMHVLTDCPHRERLGWLEQYHLNGPSLRYEFDLTRLYAKTFQDMEDSQTPDGLVPSTAPELVVFPDGFRDSPEWGSALILAAWQQYVWTGDDGPLRDHYGAMRRYLGYLEGRSRGGILDYGLGDWFDLGPRRPGVAQLTPIALTATAFYQADAATLSRIADHLGLPQDSRRYASQARQIRDAFNRAFFDPATGRYATGSETAQSLPLVLDLVDPRYRQAAFAALVSDIHAHGDTVTSGDVGYRYLLRALADGGRSDLIAKMNSRTDTPGYGYQLLHGATSLTEAWDADPRASQDHFMLGQIMEWFYSDLAGLAPDPAAPGFKRVLVRPQPAGASWAWARHDSPRGRVIVTWRIEGSRFRLDLSVPPNTSAQVRWPSAASASDVLESGRPAGSSPGVRILLPDEGRPQFSIGSGDYHFAGPYAPAPAPAPPPAK
jgi:hypothetical protein